MLTFVTTIRHPDNAVSYQRIGALLDSTLESICRQTDSRFRVIVVHNDPPPPSVFVDSRVEFLKVDFPPPGPGRAHKLSYGAVLRDKGTKSAIGVSRARALGATHVMFVDADDRLHRGIAEFVNSRPTLPGWFSPTGYIYTLGTRHVQAVPHSFNLKNGSTNIVRLDLTGVGIDITPAWTQAEIVISMGLRQVNQVLGQHEEWPSALAEQNLQLDPLPFASAVWVIGTGENHSGNLMSGRKRLSIDRIVTDAFGLVLPSRVKAARVEMQMLGHRLHRRIRRTEPK